MTIIAYRDGIMAADSRSWKGGLLYSKIQKIRRLPNGNLFAATGQTSDYAAAFQWYSNDCLGDKPKIPDNEGFRVIVANKATGLALEATFDLVLQPVCVPFAAIGEDTAESFVFGAMAAGATAEEAVRLAVEHCTWASGEVQVETL